MLLGAVEHGGSSALLLLLRLFAEQCRTQESCHCAAVAMISSTPARRCVTSRSSLLHVGVTWYDRSDTDNDSCHAVLCCAVSQVVFTIHNMNYGQKKISEAAQYCQKYTTVSPTYAFEIGGHPAIAGAASCHQHTGLLCSHICFCRQHAGIRVLLLHSTGRLTGIAANPSTDSASKRRLFLRCICSPSAGTTAKFMGIRNGIDTELWSPTENKFLPMSYDASNAEEGKKR